MDDLKSLTSKARGYRGVLARMTAKQREQIPTAEYRAEYNNFRKLVLGALPEIEKFMPPAVDDDLEIEEGSVARYVEIHTYVEQIFQLLIDATPNEAVGFA